MDDRVSESSEQRPEPLPDDSPFFQLRPSPASPGLFAEIFVGPNGLRGGWRLLLFVLIAVCIEFALSFVASAVYPRHAPFWFGLVPQMIPAITVMTSAVIMGVYENRRFGEYGLPGSLAFGGLFWAGMFWGIAGLSLLMLALRGAHAFDFGHLALHGTRIVIFAAYYAVSFLLVGFFEEFAFRGYSQFTLATGMGFWPSALLLSSVFGAGHLANPGEAWVGALAAAFIGLFFCLTLRRTGNLWFAVGMHASWDWGESYLYSVPDSGGMVKGHLLNSSFHGPRWLTGGSVGPEGSVLVFVVIAVMWIVFDRMYPGEQN